ncbi:MAG: tetratricopeptide repeat protein [Planctomycetes bacterium]|nr:tetratricopeptide repeat protein [Planctomycetota bacterium]MBI3835333.1 tetratricopeptide repeat protein [Planctomycetota bacterium]
MNIKAINRTNNTARREEDVARIKARFESADLVRRGICLLNASRYSDAIELFTRAAALDSSNRRAANGVAAAQLGLKQTTQAARSFAKQTDENPLNTTARIRRAHCLWQAGEHDEAIDSLRNGLRHDSESAELHFQLGTLLAALEHYEEAELRFTQAISIEDEHVEAIVNLGLCEMARGACTEAVTHLRKAQSLRPENARIGVLLAQGVRAVRQHGLTVPSQVAFPADSDCEDTETLTELQHIIDAEPEIVDAFLALPEDHTSRRLHSALERTLNAALARAPRRAELHYQRGRVLDRLGLRDDAIAETEHAVELEPKHAKALIELGNLYQQSGRAAEAAIRLQQAVDAGASYADVHFLLGNAYRQQGQVIKARSAYRRALAINRNYQAAAEALKTIAAA